MRNLKVGWKLFLLAVMAAAMPLRQATAQGTGTVRGTVMDSTSQQPVAGAQVSLVGTNRIAYTDASGVYRFTGVAPGAVTVRAQRIGFAQRTASVNLTEGGLASADLVLQPVVTTLSQVVVVGYGSSSRADVTGALSTVSGNDTRNTPIAGIDAALQGKAAGVQVTQNAGNPGNGISVRVRGSSSLTAGNQPLYVVDGQPIQTDDFSQVGFGGQDLTAVTSINPDEIESITVLKDAASAGIYGSRASNGVVLITTKRGISGNNRITFNGYIGQQKPEKVMKMLDGKQYVAYMAEGMANDGYTAQDIADAGFQVGVDDQFSTNWQDAIFRTAPVSDVNLGFTGGTGRMKYYLSGSYFGQDGVALGSQYNRASGRANVDIDATERLAISASLALTRETNYRVVGDNTIVGVVANSIAEQPNVPIYDTNGAFSTFDSNGLQYANPVAIATYDQNPTITQRALANVEARYNVSNWVQFTARAAGDQLVLHERLWGSPLVVDENGGVGGDAISGYNTGNRFVGESFFTLSPWSGSSRGTFTATLGASTERNQHELNFVHGQGFSSPELHDAGNATTIVSYDASRTANNLVSYFARANLGLADRYLASASLRADGSSKFGPNNRYGVFPAASLGWVITQEPFLHPLTRLGSIKLRGSYGLTGNQGISDAAYRAVYGSANYGKVAGIAPSVFGNNDLKWEQTKELDLGLDWTMFDGRVGIAADHYQKKTSNLLVSRPVSATTGFTSFTDNVGNIENKGWELELTTDNIRGNGMGGFTWQTSFNYSTNNNKVTALYHDQPFNTGIDGINRIEVGQPLGSFYTLRFTGVDPQTGDATYRDVNGDGAINSDDRVIVGNAQPTYWGGFTNTFGWKNFDLRGTIQFSGGNKIFNGIREFADEGGFFRDNKFAYVLNRWQKPGDITDEPRPSWDGNSQAYLTSSRMVEPGSYARLQDLTVGYKIPVRLARGIGMENARLYVAARNLHTWTQFTGYNPDVNSNGSGSITSLGTEFYSYPLARSWSVGLSSEW